MALFSEAQSLEEGGRRSILCIRNGRNSMGVQGAENKTKQAGQGFGGITLMLSFGRKSDPNFHLPGMILQAVNATVAEHAVSGPFHNGQLKPSARDTWLKICLTCDEARGVFGSKGGPGLEARHFRQRTIGT